MVSHFNVADDIIGLSLMLSARDSAHVESLLALAGWQIKRHARGFSAIGPEFKIEALAATQSALRAVAFRLQRKVPRRDLQFGRARLHLDGYRGELEF